MPEEEISPGTKPLYNRDLKKPYEEVRSVVNNSIDKSIKSGVQTPYKPILRKAAYFAAREQQDKLNETEKVTLIDPLTELYNLRGFNLRMDEEINRMIREEIEGISVERVLVSLDINGLKETNDSLGHGVGDKLLISTAEALKQGSRSIDLISHALIARCGDKADEFRVILSKSNLDGATTWWNRVNKLLIEKGVKISAGAARIDLKDPKKSINESDKAMYAAKELSKKTGENLMLRHDQLNPE